MAFVKATKRQARLRLALAGPAGSGKTYSALAVASALAGTGSVAVIDTERGSASKYSDLWQFDVLELSHFDPREYVAAIREAAQGGYDVLVIDSLSHAWEGKGGALDLKDEATKRSRSGNSFDAWREVTPIQNQLVDALLTAPMHLIVTMRSKTEYVLETDERGKQRPRKVGLKPIQRDGMEYEFDVYGDLDTDNNLIVGKSRCPALSSAVIAKPGKQLADTLAAWLSDGIPALPVESEPVEQPTTTAAGKPVQRQTVQIQEPTPIRPPVQQEAGPPKVDADTWLKQLAKTYPKVPNADEPATTDEQQAVVDMLRVTTEGDVDAADRLPFLLAGRTRAADLRHGECVVLLGQSERDGWQGKVRAVVAAEEARKKTQQEAAF